MRSTLRIALAFVFALAAVAKIVRPAATVETLYFLAGPLLIRAPEPAVWLVFYSIVALEVFLAWAILCFAWLAWPLWAASTTLGLFSVVLVSLLISTDAPSCGCFGEMMLIRNAQISNAAALARNIALLILIWAIWPRVGPFREQPQAAKPTGT